MRTIQEFRNQLDGATLQMIDRLREIVAASHPSLVERFKWNAPSFAVGDEDRITLGVERKGGVRLVLHRGARPRDSSDFSFDDTDGLAEWPAGDRGVIVWRDLAAIEQVQEPLALLCRRWVEQVGNGS